MSTIIYHFYQQMAAITEYYWQAIEPILQQHFGQHHQMTLLGKVWRYQNNPQRYQNATVFLPPHFDRSIFSIMLDSELYHRNHP